MKAVLIILSLLAIVYGVIGYIAYLNAKTAKNQDEVFKLPGRKLAFVLGMAVFIAAICIVRIGAQEVGVCITPLGVKSQPYNTGWHLVWPWNTVKAMDKTEWVYTFTNKKTEGSKNSEDAIWTPTKDGIKMGFDVSVTWKIDANYAPWIYQNISEMDGGDDGRYQWIEENVIRAKTISQFSLTVSEYNPIEVYSTKREEIQRKVFAKLAKELETKHIILLQVNVREVFYNSEFEKAINEKKLAEQKVLTLAQVTRQKEELLIQSKLEKDIAIQKAEGEARALAIKGNAINQNPKIVLLEWIDAWKEGGSQVPTFIGGGGDNGSNMFMLDLKSFKK